VVLLTEAKPYLQLALSLCQQTWQPAELPVLTDSLPILKRPLLEYLAQQGQQTAYRQPRFTYTLAALADAAAVKTEDIFLQGLAAWFLARAANDWLRPQQAVAAAGRAERRFARLEEPGWLAACRWQQYAHPWTHPNLEQVTDELTAALESLVAAQFDELAAHCRLSLALAQAIRWQFALAYQSVEAAESYFQSRLDYLNVARCWLTQAGCHRRQSQPDKAITRIEQALPFLMERDAPLECGRAYLQLGFCYWALGQSTEAEEAFLEALNLFRPADVPLWEAQGYNGLAQIHSHFGRLSESVAALTAARQIFADYEVAGLWADNLVDSALLEMLKGQNGASLTYLSEAETIYRQLSLPHMAALTAMYRAEAAIQLGRQQQALHDVEVAQTSLQMVDNLGRLAECETHLARTWLRLGWPAEAQTFFEWAADHSRQAQPVLLPAIYIGHAEALFAQNKVDEAIFLLQKVMSDNQEYGTPPETALSQRILGKLLAQTGRITEGVLQLQQAATTFEASGLVMELAATNVALGSAYARLGDTAAAMAAWQSALQHCAGLMPEIEWQACAGLAEVVAQQGNTAEAMPHYRQAVAAIDRLRQGLLQPILADSYLHRPSAVFDQAITLAGQLALPLDALHFVETSKAQVMRQQLVAGRTLPEASSEPLDLLRAEIRWLRDQLRANFTPGMGLRSHEESELIRLLRRKMKEYSQLADKLERGQGLAAAAARVKAYFDVEQFNKLACAHLGDNWLALDYYLTERQLYTILITPDGCQLFSSNLSGRAQMALHLCDRARQSNTTPTPADLKALGATLLPPAVRERLTPETYLLISPHRRLHLVPWPGLQWLPDQSLVDQAIPVVVPSLHTLLLLWQRLGEEGKQPASRQEPGLVIAVSTFQERHGDLPQVTAEWRHLERVLPGRTHLMVDAGATWDNLRQLAAGEGLGRFAFLHVASHAFHESLTGRLSGIALYDQDIWLDDLDRLAPFPPLVTLSACSGSLNRVYAGDEHVGLVATCLAAGANQVVGSLWPVLDEAAGQLTRHFYEYYVAGNGAARSLALAQRAVQSEQLQNWASFICVGLP
jgi:tetratricopeptide (TPR) repeat protein